MEGWPFCIDPNDTWNLKFFTTDNDKVYVFLNQLIVAHKKSGAFVSMKNLNPLIEISLRFVPWFLPWLINSLGPSDAVWRHRPWSTLAQVMACCPLAPSHNLNQCWHDNLDIHPDQFRRKINGHSGKNRNWKWIILGFLDISQGPMS